MMTTLRASATETEHSSTSLSDAAMLISHIDMARSRCPDNWSNTALAISGKLFFQMRLNLNQQTPATADDPPQ